MGFNTVTMFLNDGWDEIVKHPDEFVEKMNPLVSGGLSQHQQGFRGREFGVDFGVGHCCNNVQVVSNEHADTHVLILAGGNYMTRIGSTHAGNRGHHEREDIIKSLNECLRDLDVEVVDLKNQKLTFGEWSIDDIWMALEDHEYLDGDTLTQEEAEEAFQIACDGADFGIGFGWDNFYAAIDDVVARRKDGDS